MSTEPVNWAIFNELVLMDDDEPGFSFSLIQSFIEQAINTFKNINDELQCVDVHNEKSYQQSLQILSQHGHYLKGSAASLGLVRLQEQCERIQSYGLKKDLDDIGANTPWHERIKEALVKAREEFALVRVVLGKYYACDI